MSWLSDKVDKLDEPGAPVATTRALDADFTPSADDHTLVMYSIELTCDAGEDATVELRSDAATPPVTVRASARLNVGAGGVTTTVRQQLVYVVPKGHNVRLVTSGTGVAAIAHQTEMVVS